MEGGFNLAIRQCPQDFITNREEDVARKKDFEERANTKQEILMGKFESGEELTLNEIVFLSLRANPNCIVIS